MNEKTSLLLHLANNPYSLTPDQWASEARQAIATDEASATREHVINSETGTCLNCGCDEDDIFCGQEKCQGEVQPC